MLFKNWSSIPTPIMSPQPGAGVGIRLGDGIVAFDYDDDDAALTISEAFDPSPVCKVGQRGWTALRTAGNGNRVHGGRLAGRLGFYVCFARCPRLQRHEKELPHHARQKQHDPHG